MSGFAHSLAALRSDPALQRRSQASVEAAKARWLADAASSVSANLGRYARGQDLRDCEALLSIVTDRDAAVKFLSPLVRSQCEALVDFPLAHIPFRHQYQDGIAVLRLMETGGAALSLVMYEQTTLPSARTVCFSDNEYCEIVLAGTGEGRRLALAGQGSCRADICSENLTFVPGNANSFDGPDITKLVDRVHGCLIVLRLTRTPTKPVISREYRIDDGSLVHCASGERQTSRQEMALAVLGSMQRSDSCGEMRSLALDRSSPVRWEALRQLLALDTFQGFTCLAEMAVDDTDPLAEQAAALKARLLRAYPALDRLENELCPA